MLMSMAQYETTFPISPLRLSTDGGIGTDLVESCGGETNVKQNSFFGGVGVLAPGW
uniref:Uncharacterized protein n=1 Tax=Anguilla anguilla TaxID=7936 RepID=A0A0E9R0A3_ANGAN